MRRQARLTWLVLGSIVAAWLLQLLPLAHALLPLKPWWLALVLIYWSIETPQRVGLGFAALTGLAADVLMGNLLGEQMLRLVVMVFIVLRFRARIGFFPIWQQALAIFLLLLNDRVVTLILRGFSGDPLPGWPFWIAPVTGMLVWPLVFLVLTDLRSRLRARG